MGHRFQYQIGADFQVDPAKAAVFRDGQEVQVRYQTFQVLLYLLERRGQVVAKEELFTSIWHGKAVSDDTIAQSIAEIRRLFRDTARSPRFIRTIPRAGYVFVAPVEVAWRATARTAPHREAVPSDRVAHRWWGNGPALLGLEKW